MQRCPGNWTSEEKTAFARIINGELSTLALPTSLFAEFDALLAILEKLLQHRESLLVNERRPTKKFDEKVFQENITSFLFQDTQFTNDYLIESYLEQPIGKCDLALQKKGASEKFAVELKSDSKSFNVLVDSWAGQALHYSASSGFARFSILYVECLEDEAAKSCDHVKIRINTTQTDGAGRLVTVCLGVPRTSASASRLGKRSI